MMARGGGKSLVRAMARQLVATIEAQALQGIFPDRAKVEATCECEVTLERARRLWQRWYGIYGTGPATVSIMKVPGRLIVHLQSPLQMENDDAKSEGR